MGKEINITGILKDKPQGTKLYDWLYNRDVELDTISTTDTETVVWCTNETDNNTTCHRGYSEFGTVRGCTDGLQILLPSKEMRDWSKFFKKGDVLVSKGDNTLHVIFEGFVDDTYITFKGKHFLCDYDDNEDYNEEEYNDYQKEVSLRTIEFDKDKEDDAQIYIKTIEERLGGKLNRETLEIEKKPEFKDGDIITVKLNSGGEIICIFKADVEERYYFYAYIDGGIVINNDKSYCSKTFCTPRLSTVAEKHQLFEALAKKGKAWDAEKKAVVDLKPKCEFKPFDRCIWKIRNCEGSIWEASFVSYVDEYGAIPMGVSIDEDLVNLIILPYNEETAKLIGTTKEWKG